MKKLLVLISSLVLVFTTFVLSSCVKTETTPNVGGAEDAPNVGGAYTFVIYESDKDNSNLSDNKVVAKYTISYTNAKYVTDTLIKKDDKYYFNELSNDYLVLEDSQYGLSYKKAYFANYSGCANGEIDASWSKTMADGKDLMTGIGKTEVKNIKEYQFIIDGWR